MKYEKLMCQLAVAGFVFSVSQIPVGDSALFPVAGTASVELQSSNQCYEVAVLVEPTALDKTAPKGKTVRKETANRPDVKRHDKAAGIIEPVLFRKTAPKTKTKK